jgi:ABC-type transport system involved in multi-copper enzyme maturation permease subunit
VTALTVHAHAGHDAAPRPVPWRQMAWVTWRQHRIALSGVAVLLGGPAIYLWLAGLRLHHAFTAAVTCHPASSPVCGELAATFNNINDFLVNGVILQGLPALIGAFAGAPVLAREMETGTFRFAWTQGFGRRRWAVAKLVLLAVTITAAAGAFSVLASWYFQPYFATTDQNLGLDGMTPFFPGLFSLHGVTFAAWTLAAFAIGAVAGMLLRRVVPAIAVTLAAYAGLALAAGAYLRPRYLAPLVTTSSDLPGSAWVISQQWLTAGGQPASPSTLNQAFQSAGQIPGKGGIADVNSYLVQHGYRLSISYQPAGRFWPFQWIESGWLAALSVLLIAAAVALVGRRAS